MLRALVLPLAFLVLAVPAHAKSNACTNKSAKSVVKSDGPLKQTLRSGQFYAFGHAGGTWTFCDRKAGPKNRFKSFNFDFNGQKNKGVKLLSRPNKCVALQLRPRSNGYPSVPTVDMRRTKNAGVGSSVYQIDPAAPGATIVKTALSSTCLLGTAYRSASGARSIQLNPVIPPNVLQETIKLSEQSTDADLRALSLSGDNVSWTDAGATKNELYSGLPPR